MRTGRNKRSKNGIFKRISMSIWNRVDIVRRIKSIWNFIKERISWTVEDKILDKLEQFIWEKGFKGLSYKLIKLCKDEGIDPRYHLVQTVPEEDRLEYARAMGFEKQYKTLFDTPEYYFA